MTDKYEEELADLSKNHSILECKAAIRKLLSEKAILESCRELAVQQSEKLVKQRDSLKGVVVGLTNEITGEGGWQEQRDTLAARLGMMDTLRNLYLAAGACANKEPAAYGMPDAAGNILESITPDEKAGEMRRWAEQYSVPLFRVAQYLLVRGPVAPTKTSPSLNLEANALKDLEKDLDEGRAATTLANESLRREEARSRELQEALDKLRLELDLLRAMYQDLDFTEMHTRICEEMQPLSKEHNEWKGWPGTYGFAGAAIRVFKSYINPKVTLSPSELKAVETRLHFRLETEKKKSAYLTDEVTSLREELTRLGKTTTG